MLLAGAFSEWLSEHPDMISCVLPVLMRGLHDSSLAQSASMSLKDLVRECQLQLQPHANEILTVTRVLNYVWSLSNRTVPRVLILYYVKLNARWQLRLAQWQLQR